MQYTPHKILINRNIRPESTGIPVLSFHCQRLTKASVICYIMFSSKPKRAAGILFAVGKCSSTKATIRKNRATLNTYIKYNPLESLGLACKYLLVVATDAWPKV